jgi:hypothetical protein
MLILKPLFIRLVNGLHTETETKLFILRFTKKYIWV